MKYQYKFERFRFADFPVYSSVQVGQDVIVIPHHHKAAEVILVKQGSCQICVDTTAMTCQPGEVVYIPPYCVHTVRGNDANCTIKGITFHLSLLQAGANELETVLNKQVVSCYILNTPEARELIEKFSLEGQENTTVFRFNVLGDLYKLVSVLLKNYSSYSGNDHRMKPVIDYIQQNYNRPISLAELSALVNVCDDHFIRLFKKATNKSPVKYINDLRIEEALKLLVDSDLSITEISGKVGFSNINYMIKVFKSTLNTTPSTYRKSITMKR